MQHRVANIGDFHWIDLVDPSNDEIAEIAKKYELHDTSIQDCLNPEHLPKYENLGAYSFIVLRAFDEHSPDDSDSLQELTRKLAIFYNENVVITIHRKDQKFIQDLRNLWQKKIELQDINENEFGPIYFQLLYDLFYRVINSYDTPVEKALELLEELEIGVFDARGTRPFVIEDGYYLKRKATVFKRMLRFTMDILPKMNIGQRHATFFQNLKEEAEVIYLYTEDLTESINALLNLHISLSTQKTTEASHQINEVMRVLTIFSVFLLPLNLITGIYGMNFSFMPELNWRWGYPATLFSMLFVICVIYFWFKRQGWLKSR